MLAHAYDLEQEPCSAVGLMAVDVDACVMAVLPRHAEHCLPMLTNAYWCSLKLSSVSIAYQCSPMLTDACGCLLRLSTVSMDYHCSPMLTDACRCFLMLTHAYDLE